MNFDDATRSLTRAIIRHRWALLAFIGLVTAALGVATKGLVVDNDFDNWLPAHDRVSTLYRMADKQFSSNALVFVVLDCTEHGVFTPESLTLVQQLTGALEGIDELFNVSSLTNIVDIRKTDFGLEVGDLIPEIPATPEELNALKAYVLSKEMYVNSLVSEDAGYTAIVTNIHGEADEVVAAAKVIETVEAVAGDHPYYFGGEAALHLFADKYMRQDLATLIPGMLLVMIVILAVSFRRFWGVVLPLILVFLGILWTFGLQALFRISVTVFTPAVVVLLIAMGTDYAVHIYNHYLRRGDAEISVAQILVPVVMSAATTIVGLLTFGLTRIALLRFFGFVLAFGLGSACLLSVVLLPICFSLFRAKPESGGPEEERQEQIISRTLVRMGMWVHGHARATLAIASIGLIVMGFGIFRITTNVDYAELMPEDSPPRLGLNALRDHFSGAYPISLYFRGDMQDPALMEMQDYLENYLRSYELISGFTSINGLLAEENWLMNGVFAVPETRSGIANLWLLLEGEELLRTFVDTDRRQSLITALIKRHEADVMRNISRAVWDFHDKFVSDQVAEIDPSRLSLEGRTAVHKLQLTEAALQLAWLAQSYDKPRMYDSTLFLQGLEKAFPENDETLDLAPVWEASRAYLDEEAVEVLPPELVEQLTAAIQGDWRRAKSPGLRGRLAEMITASGAMNAEDAASTADGVLNRAQAALRLQRAKGLWESLTPLLPPLLKDHKDFRKRAEGVLWRLWTDHPVFFASRIESSPEIDPAAVVRKPLHVDQTGMADLIRRFDDLIYISQFQSLVLASLIVLALVSLTQRSFRRGLISLLSVLVPMVLIMGLMGWTKIPLDFGTALFGALIIGLGVDGSIHFLHHYHDLEARGIRGEESIRKTMGHVGKAIVTANATTCCGFLVLMFSKTTMLRNFAIVNALAIFLVTFSLLTFMPALITLFHADVDRDQGSGVRGRRAERRLGRAGFRGGKGETETSGYWEGDMKRKKPTIHSIVILAVFLAAARANALTGDEVLRRVDAVLSAPNDGTSTATMTLIDKSGKTKERRLQLWTRYFKDKDDWSLTKFLSPPEVRDLGFLSLADDQMYLYLPAFDRVRRIASHARKESFAGSDLSNDDLSTGKYENHFSAKITKETEQEYVLELTRKPGSDRIYPKLTVWVNKENFTIPRMELFDKNQKLWKTFEGEYKQIQGYWTMTSLTMTDVQKEHKTIMTLEDIQFDVGLEDKTFTQRYLKRRVKVD